MRRANLIGWVTTALAAAVAIALTLAAAPPDEPPPANEEAKRAAFFVIASEETEMRAKGQKSFPTDRWSQDDDFHNQERERAKTYANANRLRLADVLSAIDEGLREKWPHNPKTTPRVTVPPCQPRAIY